MTHSIKKLNRNLKMGAAAQIADELQVGRVYRRMDLAHLSKSVYRHINQLLSIGMLKKLARGLYYAPRHSRFGPLPPSDEQVVKEFLRDTDFLILSPSSYNTVGLGTTQLWQHGHSETGSGVDQLLNYFSND